MLVDPGDRAGMQMVLSGQGASRQQRPALAAPACAEAPLAIRPDGEEDGAKFALRVSRDYTPVMVDGWHSCARAAQSGCRD